MIKPPEKAPDWKTRVKTDFKTVFRFSKSEVIQNLVEKTDKLYYYWDKIRAQPLPSDFDKKEIWAFIRFRRFMNSSPTPIEDVHKKPFTFWLPDDIQKNLHLIDQNTGGHLALWDAGADRNASAKYMVTSLMEEAITSSQIEGAVATIKQAKRMLLENRKPKDKSERMIFNNYLTMQAVKSYAKQDLDIPLLLELHTTITKDTLDSKEEEGRFRGPDDKVRVETAHGDVLFIPPKSEEILDRIKALIDFANNQDDAPFIHPVVKAIMLHFWIAYIHPFTDGNGRLARTLFYWYLLKHGYWLFEYTSISKTILKRTTKYANAYLYSEHDDNDLTYFIHFNIEVIMEAVKELKEHIQQEKERNEQIRQEISEHPDLNMRQTLILRHLMSNPNSILTINAHQKLNGISYQTARTDLLELEEKNWLKRVKKGKAFYFIAADGFLEKLSRH